MKKYNIEGNIDFFSELYKSLDIEEKINEDENLCLITGLKLENHYITLKCGHKFNYIPLFYDIKNHKQKFNNMEGHISHLKHDEIRCPYCRNKQKELLPYFKEIGLPKVHGVNCNDINKKPIKSYSTDELNKCSYLTTNPNYDPSGNNPIEKAPPYSKSNCQFFTCLNNGFYQLSGLIVNYDGEDKCVCYCHKKKIIKDNKEILKQKAKQDKIYAKEKAKQEKEAAKLKVKSEKKKIKQDSENVVLGPSIIISVNPLYTKCIEILKSGPNKGNQCGCKVYSYTFCKRHSKKLEPKPEPKSETEPETESEPEI